MTEEEKRRKNPYAVDGDTVYDRLRSDRPTYAATYEQPLADLYQRITTRPGFQYDVTADPLYQQYKGQYIQQGKLAMRDTMGQAAALTGGYGSTYGQQVGQQAYDAYLQKLGDVVPDLYSAAYGRYADEGDRLMQQYALLGQQRDDEYTRYRNELADWQDAENRNYSIQQQNYSNLYSLIGASGYTPTDEELAAAGMSREAANAIRMEYLRKNGLTGTAVGSGGSDESDSGSRRERGPSEENESREKDSRKTNPAAQAAADAARNALNTVNGQDSLLRSMDRNSTTLNTIATRDDDFQAAAYLAYLKQQGFKENSQVYQSFARAHGMLK